jgi:hypothetical protein
MALIESYNRESLRSLAAAFRVAGWRVESRKRSKASSPDLIVEKGPLRYAVELKVARQGRRRLLAALLADALIRSDWYASQEEGSIPLAVVGAPLLSDSMAKDLHNYVARFAPGRAYGLIDLEGRLELKGPGLESVQGKSLFEHFSVLPEQSPPDLFSDRSQWMLKILLAPRIPPELLGSPHVLVRSPAELARIAEVSAPSAYRLVSRLKIEGFLDASAPNLKLVRVRELLERWRAANLKPMKEVPARWLIPGDQQNQLVKALAAFDKGRRSQRPYRFCLGLFSACGALGFGFVGGAPQHLYADRIEILKDLGLRRSNVGEVPNVFVRVPRFPESVFRAAVEREGVAVADLVQDWLDVVDHPVRGAEQAQQLWDRVLHRLEKPGDVSG